MRKTDKELERERYGYDAAWEMLKRHDERQARLREQFKAMWKMTPAQRLSAMRRGELTYRQLLEWAKRAPEEVPMINCEWEFIAATTPEIAEREH
ncbi:MAG TPA: hypothetical protein VFW38_03230 [Solirubrobacteraceae bacterium]|nr:hypothetical protein [Solirubrobacteraceae bacterium]